MLNRDRRRLAAVRQGRVVGQARAAATASPGGFGGFGANRAGRQSTVFVDVPTLQQPEAGIGFAGRL